MLKKIGLVGVGLCVASVVFAADAPDEKALVSKHCGSGQSSCEKVVANYVKAVNDPNARNREIRVQAFEQCAGEGKKGSALSECIGQKRKVLKQAKPTPAK